MSEPSMTTWGEHLAIERRLRAEIDALLLALAQAEAERDRALGELASLRGEIRAFIDGVQP